MPGARAAGVSRASLSYNIASYIHIRNDEIVAVARARARYAGMRSREVDASTGTRYTCARKKQGACLDRIGDF